MDYQAAEIVDDRSFPRRVLEPQHATLVLFTAPDCLPCTFLARGLPSLASDLNGAVDFISCPVEASPRTVRRFSVARTPALLLFMGGGLIASRVGPAPLPVIRRWVTDALESHLGVETGRASATEHSKPADGAPRTALVLSGGGITGFLYEIGVLAALEHALPPGSFKEHFDLFVGTSAGAVTAALLANGAPPSEIFHAVSENLDSPFNFRPDDVFGTAAKSPLQLVTQFARPLGGAIARALRPGARPTLASLLADFQEHHPPGFYSTEPLERTLCDRFTALGYPHQFDQLSHGLYVTGADIDTGERLIFGEGELANVHICRAVAASCAIPIFFQPIRIGERDVVDGGVAGATPIDVAADRGARLIVYINPLVPVRNDRTNMCVPLDGGRCARLAEKGVGWVADQSLRMLLTAKLADTLVALQVRHPGLTVRGIEPRPDELPMFQHNVMSFAARRELLDYGYACGQRATGGRLEHVRQLAGTRGAGPGDLLEVSG